MKAPYIDLDQKKAKMQCMFSIIAASVLIVAAVGVAIPFGVKAHYQLFLGAGSVLTMIVPVVILGFLYKKNIVGKNFFILLLVMLLPILFGLVGIATSTHVPADDFVGCKTGFWHPLYKRCIVCQPQYCIDYAEILAGGKNVCNKVMVQGKNSSSPLCS
ncbi:uncharacterized protein MONOS_6545 [Monocercomonoides exilis]|uniref:uncharacterized protein n=1 Tax=Monocercomonoides exilis TaxID=2049356 RepID=UPI00355A9CAB|nr:hypothetical protein MONOS_6545 [Monocercomonoides exilis]|eukprot:MONOS_6545.1-p1 / transcript=MONOS_6545.1 / gene=MONOS_6545 / organism=Monocercomonoides_exilis_PA203 / gene_product=unspecified product / transcript_product=unspecified product / location=Mono_scaffold00207:84417-85021(-) / protein_length=159 / sequence_SO=supercontig / SO=protein_coding / is_pseudo=false